MYIYIDKCLYFLTGEPVFLEIILMPFERVDCDTKGAGLMIGDTVLLIGNSSVAISIDILRPDLSLNQRLICLENNILAILDCVEF
jgi:hypothetical protein